MSNKRQQQKNKTPPFESPMWGTKTQVTPIAKSLIQKSKRLPIHELETPATVVSDNAQKLLGIKHEPKEQEESSSAETTNKKKKMSPLLKTMLICGGIAAGIGLVGGLIFFLRHQQKKKQRMEITESLAQEAVKQKEQLAKQLQMKRQLEEQQNLKRQIEEQQQLKRQIEEQEKLKQQMKEQQEQLKRQLEEEEQEVNEYEEPLTGMDLLSEVGTPPSVYYTMTEIHEDEQEEDEVTARIEEINDEKEAIEETKEVIGLKSISELD